MIQQAGTEQFDSKFYERKVKFATVVMEKGGRGAGTVTSAIPSHSFP